MNRPMPIEIEKPQATCRRAASMSFLAMALASSEVVATACADQKSVKRDLLWGKRDLLCADF